MSDDSVTNEAREYALNALARREHSRHELAHKLNAKGYEASAVNEVLTALAAAGLQDDQRFAEAYVRYRGARGYGPRRIGEELRQRGISDSLKASALAAADQDWFESAASVHRKKFRTPPESFADRARHSRFLQYRGFDNEQIRYALGHSSNDENL